MSKRPFIREGGALTLFGTEESTPLLLSLASSSVAMIGADLNGPPFVVVVAVFFENASIGVGAEMEVEGTSFVARVVFEECPMDPSSKRAFNMTRKVWCSSPSPFDLPQTGEPVPF